MNYKKYDELELQDDFMFGKVMQNSYLRKGILEALLGIQINNIEYPEAQKGIQITAGNKSVRLDVYVEDDNNRVFDAEMQRRLEGTRQKSEGNLEKVLQESLAKRSRYYQGMIDLNLLNKGLSYDSLKESYIIFLCAFDLFGKGYYCYTFKPYCIEDNELLLPDRTTRIFYNLNGTKGNITEEARAVLRYLKNHETSNEFTRELDREVGLIKRNEKWEREYMKELIYYDELKKEAREEGLEEGREEGRVEGREEGREEGRVEGRVEGLSEGIRALIHTCKSFGMPQEIVLESIIKEFTLSKEKAYDYIHQYW